VSASGWKAQEIGWGWRNAHPLDDDTADRQTKYEEGLALVLPVSMQVGGEEKAEDGGMNLEVEVVLPACWRDVKLDVLINPEDNRVVFF